MVPMLVRPDGRSGPVSPSAETSKLATADVYPRNFLRDEQVPSVEMGIGSSAAYKGLGETGDPYGPMCGPGGGEGLSRPTSSPTKRERQSYSTLTLQGTGRLWRGCGDGMNIAPGHGKPFCPVSFWGGNRWMRLPH